VILSKQNEILFKSLKEEIEDTLNLKVRRYISEPKFNNQAFEEFNKKSKFDLLITNFNIKLCDYIHHFNSIVVYEPIISANKTDYSLQIRKICDKNKLDYSEFEPYSLERVLGSAVLKNDSPDESNHQIIVSEIVYENFVEILEGNLGLSLICQDYQPIRLNIELEKKFKAPICDLDILFDEQTGLILYEFDLFTKFDDNQTRDFLIKLKNYKHCLNVLYFVMVVPHKNESTFSTECSNSKIIYLTNYFDSFNKTESNFCLKFLVLQNLKFLKRLVQKILITSREMRMNHALTYPILDHTMSYEEFILVSSRCFNSFSAKSILSITDVASLCDLYERNQLSIRFPLIMPQQAQMFFNILNSDSFF
jgi:hypothetical protein